MKKTIIPQRLVRDFVDNTQVYVHHKNTIHFFSDWHLALIPDIYSNSNIFKQTMTSVPITGGLYEIGIGKTFHSIPREQNAVVAKYIGRASGFYGLRRRLMYNHFNSLRFLWIQPYVKKDYNVFCRWISLPEAKRNDLKEMEKQLLVRYKYEQNIYC